MRQCPAAPAPAGPPWGVRLVASRCRMRCWADATGLPARLSQQLPIRAASNGWSPTFRPFSRTTDPVVRGTHIRASTSSDVQGAPMVLSRSANIQRHADRLAVVIMNLRPCPLRRAGRGSQVADNSVPSPAGHGSLLPAASAGSTAMRCLQGRKVIRPVAGKLQLICAATCGGCRPASPVHLHLPNRFCFDGPRDPHRNYRDIGDLGFFHAAELAVPTGRHYARDAGRRLNELSCFHDDFPTVISTLKCSRARGRRCRSLPAACGPAASIAG